MRRVNLYLSMTLMCFLFAGCLGNEGAHNGKPGSVDETNDNNPIAYNTKQEEAERRGITNTNSEEPRDPKHYLEGFQTDLGEQNTQNTTYSDYFYSEDSKKVSEAVNELDEVNISQVMVTEEHVVVSVMLNRYEYSANMEEITEKIVNRAEQVIPNKEVIVYTDDIYWKKMRDLNSGIENR